MQIGMIGLGRMGKNMVRRLRKRGHECVAYDRDLDRVKDLAEEGTIAAFSLEDLAAKTAAPKIVWLMLPAGEPTETTVAQLSRLLPADSTIIDGGNSFYKDDIRRNELLKAKGINYLDVGVSGGIRGFEYGYCLMIGGDEKVARRFEPIFEALAPEPGYVPSTIGRDPTASTAERGFLYCGPPGAGHFVKMIHNSIEYGLMQSYAEGFDILYNATSPQVGANLRYTLNLADIAELWRHGSVVNSYLLDLMAMALAEDPALLGYSGFVEDTGEVRWTIERAMEQSVPTPALSVALFTRFRSRQLQSFSEKALSALRKQFGGHVEPANSERSTLETGTLK
jgi:6-phosphogluconate dehydrogenase